MDEQPSTAPKTSWEHALAERLHGLLVNTNQPWFRNVKLTLVWILIIGAIAVMLAYWWGSHNPNAKAQLAIIKQAEIQIQEKYAADKKALEAQIAQKQAQIKDLFAENLKRIKTIKQLQAKRDAIKPPQSMAELRDRFEVLGYKPTEEKVK